MEYQFYGWETADVHPCDRQFESIRDPRHLYDILSEIWCEYTCAPRMRKDWSLENRTLGQCSITSFLVQDIFGGKVYGIPLKDGSVHCFNDIDGCVFDLTSEQFKGEALDYEHVTEQFRENHFQKQEKYERYQYLKKALMEYLGKGE